MRKGPFYLCSFLFFIASHVLIAQKKLIVQIHPTFNGLPLVLNDKIYLTENKDSISIEEFKFYISGIIFSGDENLYADKKGVYLLDAEDSSTFTFGFDNIPAGTYNSLTLNIGVDSLANVSGALEGALDPTLGMYWAWNTGYINAKLVGKSPSCKTLHNAFEFHIGGYKEPYKTLRKVQLTLPQLVITDSASTTLNLHVNIAKWFAGVRLFALNNVVIPSQEAMKMADNYMEMFQVSKIITQGKE
jgi:hypothetical protein